MDVKRKVDIIRVNPQDWPKGTPAEKAEDPDLGNDMIPVERYYSRDFMALEWERIWTKTWLLGGRSCDLKEPGDYICTDIGRESVIIVRQADGSLRAFPNVCLHRGNRLRPEGIGNAENFRCMYHHWTYDCEGKITRIPDLSSFPQGAPPEGRLPSLPCGEWGHFVWFSLNADAEPLEDYLNVIPQHLNPYHFERMAWKRDITIEWDCNWKTAADAFHENYHVQGIHPQLQWYLDDVNVQIDCYDKHSRYLVPFATISPRVALPSTIPPAIDHMMRQAGMDPAEYEGRVSDIRIDLQKFIRRNAKAQGKDFSDLNDDQLTDDYHYSIFPNVSMNIHAEDVMMFRHRPHPTDPDKMLYDLWMFELVPDGHDWPKRPKHQHFKHGDRSIGQVLDQDAYNLPSVQKGMHSSAFKGLWINEQELRIRHFHHTIDRFIYGEDGRGPGDI